MASNAQNSVDSLLEKIKRSPEKIVFEDVIDVIATQYEYQATQFSNGEKTNVLNTNEASCKIFYFGKINSLTEEQTLACFGRYYREDVLLNPEGTDHENIRHFMKTGWSGIKFNRPALV